jgi:WD40 repeat protein/serine/threonine protein kinase/DNA-binding XRE family transcriptional regulator
MDRDISFGSIVKEHRQAFDLTQAELARRVACATITIRKIEYDALRPSIQIAERLATSLKIPMEERAAFVRLARTSTLKTPTPQPLPTPPPTAEEIGLEDLSGRAIRGYELGDRMGEGGFGVVYRAVQPLVEREVAVKIILPRYADHPEFIRRFETEAQLVARLEHPHIVPLYDYWREPGAAFLIMRLMRGGSLHSQLKEGPLSLEFILRLLNQVGGALYAAHRMGVIHRDLKPANILLDEDHNAYLSDFGVAKNLGSPEQTSETMLAGIIGSPAYISPEQCRSEPIRPQADIYALGILLFQLLTGQQPFKGPTPIDYFQQHLNQPTPPLLEYNPNLPPQLEPVLERATAKTPDERYADIPSLVSDFQAAFTSAGADLPPSITLEWLPAEQVELQEIENPYKGLRAFEEADAEHFFGRETLVQDLLSRMSEEGDLSRFLAVVGPSGSGKSSVVKAGLMPSLRRGGLPNSENWFIVEFTPGAHPFEELETALLRVAVDPPESLLGQLRQDERGLLRAVQRILPPDKLVELVLVIDQFEELFTLVEDEETRAAFLESLVTSLLDERSRLRVVITLRADFTDRPLEYVDFGELLRQRAEFVLPLTPDELEQAITLPSRGAGLTLEPGLCQRIIGDLGDQPGTLPLLQYALTELFERRVGRRLTLSAYQDSGGVLGALGMRAEEIYSALDPSGQEAARQVFLRLVTLGEGVEDTRRRVLQAELESLTPHSPLPHMGEEPVLSLSKETGVRAILDSFGRARLLSFDRDPLTRGPTVEVAHEALLQEWRRLREWLDESRADIRMQRVLSNAALEWQEAERDPGFLMRGSRLDQFEAWVETTGMALTQVEGDYLEASLAERKVRQAAEAERLAREAAMERRSRNFLRALVVVFAVAAVVAIGLTIFAFNQQGIAQSEADQRATAEVIALEERQEALNQADARATQQAIAETERDARAVAEEQALEDRDRAVAAEADALDQREQARVQASIGLASQSELELSGTASERAVLLALEALEDYPYTWQAENALSQAILNSRLRLIAPFHGDLLTAEWSADGTRILIAGSVETGDFDYENGFARVLEASTGEELLMITDGEPTMASWAPDEKFILTLGWGQEAVPKFTNLGEELAEIEGLGDHEQIHTSVVKIWDAESGKDLVSLDTEDLGGGLWPNINGWDPWSPRGDRFLTYTVNGLVKIFDAYTGETLQTLSDYEGIVHEDLGFSISQALWSPGGDLLAISSIGDDSVIVYQADTGEALYKLPGGFETKVVAIGSWSPNGEQFVTRGVGGAKVYEAATGRQLLDLSVPQVNVFQALWSPDGSRILLKESGDSATVWDAESGQQLIHITDMVFALWADWSPSSEFVAIGAADGFMHVWDVVSGQEFAKLSGTMGHPNYIEFAPDGESILVAGDDNTVNLLDLTEAALSIPVPTCGWFSNVAWSPDGEQVAIGSNCPPDEQLMVWDANSGEQILTLRSEAGMVYMMAWSPSGDRIAATYDDLQGAMIWDAVSGEKLWILQGHSGEYMSDIDWSPDGSQLATAGADGEVILWDATTGNELLTFSGHQHAVLSVAWSPDGSRIVSTSNDGEAMIWEATTGEVLLELFPEDFKTPVSDAKWAQDGKRVILLSADGYVRIFDAESGVQLSQFYTPIGSDISIISLSPTEEHLIIGGYDGAAKAYNIATGTEMISYDVGGVVFPAYSPDGRRVLIGNIEGDWGSVQIFPTWHSTDELIDYAYECCVVRELTADERELFGLPPR